MGGAGASAKPGEGANLRLRATSNGRAFATYRPKEAAFALSVLFVRLAI